MTKQVGFFVGGDMMIQSQDTEMVKKLEDYVTSREFEYIKLPGNDGQVTYARLDCIPAFTFRELSSITGLNGRPLALVKDNDAGTSEDSTIK